MVAIEEEFALAVCCLNRPANSIVVPTDAERAARARRRVVWILLSVQQECATAHDLESTP